MRMKKGMPLWGKILIGLSGSVLALVLAVCAVVWAVWHNEILTALSMKQVRERDDSHKDGSVYVMHVRGGFYLDEFVRQGGVKSDDELIGFITDSMTKGMIPMNIKSSEVGCASFTARTEAGDALFARNYDFNKTNTCIVFTEANKGRHASVSTIDLQFLGLDRNRDVEGLMNRITCLAAPYVPLDGVNDVGVSCGIYMSYQGSRTVPTDQNTGRPDITSTTLLRLILDYADDLDEAVKIAESYDLHDSAGSSFQYMIADASGRSAILSWINGKTHTDNDGSARQLAVTYSDDDAHIGMAEGKADYQWITNFVILPGYYDGAAASAKKGVSRYDMLTRALNQADGVVADEREAMEILRSIGRRKLSSDDSNNCTVHSVVYNLTDRTALWVPNEHFDDPDAIYEFRVGDRGFRK